VVGHEPDGAIGHRHPDDTARQPQKGAVVAGECRGECFAGGDMMEKNGAETIAEKNLAGSRDLALRRIGHGILRSAGGPVGFLHFHFENGDLPAADVLDRVGLGAPE